MENMLFAPLGLPFVPERGGFGGILHRTVSVPSGAGGKEHHWAWGQKKIIMIIWG